MVIFSVIPCSKVPTGFRVFPGVWTLVCKPDILTREIKKYKARLALDGSRMREGEDYDKTYAMVALWMSIRLLLTFVVAFGWQTHPSPYRPRYVYGIPTWFQSSWWYRQKSSCLETPS